MTGETAHGRIGRHPPRPPGLTAAALRLGRFFEVDPKGFMAMQAKYNLRVQAERLAAALAAIEPRRVA